MARRRRGLPRLPRVTLRTRGRTRRPTYRRAIRPRRRRYTRGGGGGTQNY